MLEAAGHTGGKIRTAQAGAAAIDAGPTVLTMRWVFDALFDDAGVSLESQLRPHRTELLARHAWGERQTLDLFSDIEQSADAIGALAGAAEARGYRAFCARAQRIYEALEDSFIHAPRPTARSLAAGAGMRGLIGLWGLSPFATLWDALGEHFRDPRLRQLFGRYATYSGSSPFLAPATLMLIAHVERLGVWLVEGGMARLAAAMTELARRCGATVRCEERVDEILVPAGRAKALRLQSGECIEADAILSNVD